MDQAAWLGGVEVLAKTPFYPDREDLPPLGAEGRTVAGGLRAVQNFRAGGRREHRRARRLRGQSGRPVGDAQTADSSRVVACAHSLLPMGERNVPRGTPSPVGAAESESTTNLYLDGGL